MTYLAVLYKIKVFCHYISWNGTILLIFLRSAIITMTSPLLWTWRADRDRIDLVTRWSISVLAGEFLGSLIRLEPKNTAHVRQVIP